MVHDRAEGLRGRLDHAGVIVNDLASGARLWESLGFLLSPESRQRGRLPGRDETGPWATANRCAIFEDGYLELIGIVEPDAYNPWQDFLARREGVHILALRVESADQTWAALQREGMGTDATLADAFTPPVQRERSLDVAGETRTMRFRNVFSRDEACPEARLILIEHQTPEYLWQPRYLRHPNGARGLAGLFFCCDLSGADDPAHPCGRLITLTGARIEERSALAIHLRTPAGHDFHVLSPEGFGRRFGQTPVAAPAYLGAAIRFDDCAQAAGMMARAGALIERRDRDWLVRLPGLDAFFLTLEPNA